MATISKFYLHKAAQTFDGTQPAHGTASTASTTKGVSQSYAGVGSQTLYAMDGNVGSSQTDSGVINTGGTTLAQFILLGRWFSRPMNAQTIGAQNWTFRAAALESNANVNFFWAITIAVYASNGALSGRIYDAATALGAEPGITETDSGVQTVAGSAITVSAGDVLCFEASCTYTQAMATVYTVQCFFDGTTEGSITSNAAYIAPTTAINMQSPPPLPPAPRVISQAVQRAATRCWTRRRSGIVVPRLWTPEEA